MERYCNSCGKQVHEMAEICPSCGCRLARSSILQPKKRWVYILLGLLFGQIGVHDFYARHFGRAVAYLLCTVAFAAMGAFPKIIVVYLIVIIIEICVTKKDGHGLAFA